MRQIAAQRNLLFLRNTAVDLPAFNIALVNVLAKQKKRLPLDYNEILFLQISYTSEDTKALKREQKQNPGTFL